ncbi:MAG TPA: uL15 family ribosomal protein [Candidatus Paceibacterota bacterium]|nr:uL15 family ribosomal protein [Candidatus Paceibacterota bacterium]HMP19181.1 uL15 family ribosomal protein [Candidatus Paceibacterota bacterium]HMP85288.1 uL15 family ribosomal protein [Candidatus Paceibacterota bacterium]
MKIHQIIKNKKLKKSRLIGRGGKRGKTSGKGTKGQKARSGRKIRPEIRDIIKKIPKLRGRGVNYNKSRFAPFVVLNLSKIESAFDENSIVNKKSLFDKNLIKKINGKFPRVKITYGDIKKKINFSGLYFTEKAKQIVAKVGGKIK